MNKTSFLITGKRTNLTNQIWVDGKLLNPSISQKIRNHSPDGFNWGYAGSGPAQAALAICLEIFPKWMAEALYQQFKFTFVASWLQDEFHIVIDIADFLVKNRDLIQRAGDDRYEEFE